MRIPKCLHFIPVLFSAFSLAAADTIREGDIVFTSSELGQGEAIIAATGSPYTHCGVVFEKNGKLMVLEA
ncbi:MAG: peptidase, partial [Verrucomicrobiaceae bacterium]